jgi:DNA-binding transcriptional LysR family regulator
MDLDLLRAFATAARSSSLTEAAGRLDMSQPGLSRRLSRLEASLGTRLLQRSRSGVSLTPAGELLLRTADRVLADLDRIVGDLGTHRQDLAGDVRIHASSVPGEYLLPPLLAGFLARHPQVGVDVAVSDSAGVVDAVVSGEADLGVCGDRFERSDLTFRPLARDTLVLAVPSGHPLAGRRDISLDELRHHQLLRRERGSGTQRVAESLLARAGIEFPPTGAQRSFGSTQATLAAVRAGIGLALISSLAARSSPGIVGIPLRGLDASRWLSLVLPSHGTRRPTVAALVAHLGARPDGTRAQ